MVYTGGEAGLILEGAFFRRLARKKGNAVECQAVV